MFIYFWEIFRDRLFQKIIINVDFEQLLAYVQKVHIYICLGRLVYY